MNASQCNFSTSLNKLCFYVVSFVNLVFKTGQELYKRPFPVSLKIYFFSLVDSYHIIALSQDGSRITRLLSSPTIATMIFSHVYISEQNMLHHSFMITYALTFNYQPFSMNFKSTFCYRYYRFLTMYNKLIRQ